MQVIPHTSLRHLTGLAASLYLDYITEYGNTITYALIKDRKIIYIGRTAKPKARYRQHRCYKGKDIVFEVISLEDIESAVIDFCFEENIPITNCRSRNMLSSELIETIEEGW